MARPADDIAAELALFGLSDLEALIEKVRDEAGASRWTRRATPEARLAAYLLEDLVELKIKAEGVIQTLAADQAETEAQEEADEIAAELADMVRSPAAPARFTALGEMA